MINLRDIVCVILCGGQGKRMGSAELHKTCFPIAGSPAIVRCLSVLKAAGLSRFVVVVGQKAEQVMSTVAAVHPEASFVYQAQPRGTGHAVACAAETLEAAGLNGHVLVTMGDKVIEPRVVGDLVARHDASGADVTIASLPKTDRTTAGRIVMAAGRPLGIVELPDIRRAAESGRKLRVGGRRLTAGQVERMSSGVNASLYIFKAEALQRALAGLRDDNVQGELYLTDTVAIIGAGGGQVAVLDVTDEEALMAFNTPAELLAVEEVVARRRAGRRRVVAASAGPSRSWLRPAGAWLKIIESNGPGLDRQLLEIYGDDADLLAERRRAFRGVLRAFVKRCGPRRRIVLVRAPGRVNLMGRHVDHRGGYVNVMAISREVVLAAAPRDDDLVTLTHVRSKEFPHRSFRIGELLGGADWFEWIDFINSATVRQVRDAQQGDWSNYAKAAMLRLQHACPDHRLAGMDCLVDGNVPMGAGLSSSSAVVVAVAEAAVALNRLHVTMQEFVDLCGEGEWFVGSRGGSADHAAIRSGRRGRVARVGFFPFRIEQTIAWPKGFSLVIANSHVRADKSGAARDIYNQRVACYRLAEMFLRRHGGILRSLEHLRDVSDEALGVSPAEIYRALTRVPVQVTRASAARLLPDQCDLLSDIFATHNDVGPYRPRDVAMFGIAECRRSDMFADILRAGDIEGIGLLMRISHDGDRVLRCRDGRLVRFAPSYSDARLTSLIRAANSSDPSRRASAALWRWPGRYACSTPEIDSIVDLAGAVEGVLGAQVAGAGLGGCVMVLVRTDRLSALKAALRKGYYRSRGLSFDVHVCRPVGGSGLLNV